MGLLSQFNNSRYLELKNLAKKDNSLFLMNWINTKDTLSSKSYFDDSSTFLATSTAGFSKSVVDISGYVISPNFSPVGYQNLAIKPVLQDRTQPYNLAPVANAQIDQADTINVAQNSTIRIVFSSNTAAANASVVLASDSAYTNKYTKIITGSSVNVGTVANPLFVTVDDSEISSWTPAGTPNPAQLLFRRFIGVNASATVRITPIALYTATNSSRLTGSLLSWSACCPDAFNLKREMDKAELKCGQSIVGEVVTSDKFTVEFELKEFSMDFLAYTCGSVITNEIRTIPQHLTGYGVGNNTNKILPDAATPTRGQIQLPAGARIASVAIDCANMLYKNFNTFLSNNINSELGNGQYTIDPATNILIFNTSLINKSPTIMIYVNKNVEIATPVPNQMGDVANLTVQTHGDDGRVLGYFMKKVQFVFPEMSTEDEGQMMKFELTCQFARKGDVEIYKI